MEREEDIENRLEKKLELPFEFVKSSLDFEAKFYYKRDWSEAGGDFYIDVDYLAFPVSSPFSLHKELIKKAIESPSRESEIYVEGEHRVHQEAWHHASDYHTGGPETAERVRIRLSLKIEDDNPLLSVGYFSAPSRL